MLLTFLEEIELSRIDPTARPIRRYQTTEADDIDELAISINEKGLLQPIVVRPVADRFEIVAGNRRLEACRKLGWRKITCHVAELTDKEAYEASMVENIQRKTMDPLEEAEAFKDYIEKYGYGGASDQAKSIGKSQEYVSRRVRLLDLPDKVQREVMRRRISPSVAAELLRFSGEDIDKLQRLILEKRLKREDIRLIKRSKLDIGNNEPPLAQEYYLSIEKKKHDINRALGQSMAALKVCMMRLDDIIDYVGDEHIIEKLDEEWIIKDLLLELRMRLHDNIDEVLKIKHKLRKYNRCA